MSTLSERDLAPNRSELARQWARGLACGLLAFAGALCPALAQEAPLGSDLQGLLAFAKAQSCLLYTSRCV